MAGSRNWPRRPGSSPSHIQSRPLSRTAIRGCMKPRIMVYNVMVARELLLAAHSSLEQRMTRRLRRPREGLGLAARLGSCRRRGAMAGQARPPEGGQPSKALPYRPWKLSQKSKCHQFETQLHRATADRGLLTRTRAQLGSRRRFRLSRVIVWLSELEPYQRNRSTTGSRKPAASIVACTCARSGRPTLICSVR